MTSAIDVTQAREALAALPEGTSHGDERPAPDHVYLPPSHVKAMDPDTLVVTGMRGAGKTFWWSALQDPGVRRLVGQSAARSALGENAEVRTGFGVKPSPDDYPSKDALRRLLADGVEPRTIWRTVHSWRLAPDDHPLRRNATWKDRVRHVDDDPEQIDRLFQQRDTEFDDKGSYFLVLFDALDRCSDDWKAMYRLIRGLMQAAIDVRPYRRLRIKVFLRSDQVAESEIGDFPDASKVLSSAVELSWPARDLYGLLWHHLGNRPDGESFRTLLDAGAWPSVEVNDRRLYSVPRRLIREADYQRRKFHEISGPWMGTDRRRGFPYTWIPNHLADTEGRVSPRSFLAALRTAAEDTGNERPDHQYALHYDSIKRGVQEASKIRVRELQEDHPWMHRALEHLAGMFVPCEFEEVAARWRDERVLDRLAEEMKQDEVKLPPRHMAQGADGVRKDIEDLGVFQRLRDGRVNVPDVFRVGYGLGRKGGVKPVR